MIDLKPIEAEVAQWPGAEIARVTQGRKHGRLYLRYGEGERFITIPTSQSDNRRGDKNRIRDVRSVLGELGATRKERRKAKVKRQRNRPVREPLPNIERAEVKDDPFAVLASIEFSAEAEAPRKGHLREAMRQLAGSVQRIVARWRSHAPKPSQGGRDE